jgi:hypothetical protein
MLCDKNSLCFWPGDLMDLLGKKIKEGGKSV